jgi:uracil-DNA glycosylase
MQNPMDKATAEAILRWHVDAGVDLAIDDAPHDRFAESKEVARRPAASVPDRPAPASAAPPGRVASPTPPKDATESARLLAASARTLEELRAVMDTFEGCSLKATATQLVFADGNPRGGLMLVGEAPGADEDRQGKPFVGRAGRLLDKMLAAIGLDRSQAYIANIVPWRPPGNRTPTPQETAICLPFIYRQIELAAPRVLVTLGNPSTQTLLNTKVGIMKMRGRWASCMIAGRAIPTMPTLHPAYLLRTPTQKKLAWRDVQAIGKAFRESGPAT